MVIDSHVHCIVPGFTRGKFLRENARTAAFIYNRVHKTNITPADYIEMMKTKVDPDSSKLLADMDKAGVDVSIIFGVDWAYGRTGEPRVNNREQNRFHAETAKKFPDRFLSLAALDPRRPDCLDQAKEAMEEWGMKGFKLHPSSGWFPTDPVCYPLYEKISDWGVPIVFHSGGGEGNWVPGQPMYIATVAEQFPDINIVMAHAGLESWQQALTAAAFIPNIYLDISVHQITYSRRPEKFYTWLRELIDEAGPWKILFASDTPLPNNFVPLNDWVKAIREPETNIPFSKEELDIVMGKSAQVVFNLK